jgi:hypothetical protein
MPRQFDMPLRESRFVKNRFSRVLQRLRDGNKAICQTILRFTIAIKSVLYIKVNLMDVCPRTQRIYLMSLPDKWH